MSVGVIACQGPRPATGSVAICHWGDSITRGTGSTDGNGFRQILYDDLVADLPALTFPNEIGTELSGTLPTRFHEGQSGATVGTLITRVTTTPAIQALNPQLGILLVGTNNATNDTTEAAFYTDLPTYLTLLHGYFPSMRMVVSEIPPTDGDAAKNARIVNMNAAIPGILEAARDWGLQVEYTPCGTLGPGNYADTLHPNDSGYAIIAAAWLPACKASLGYP